MLFRSHTYYNIKCIERQRAEVTFSVSSGVAYSIVSGVVSSIAGDVGCPDISVWSHPSLAKFDIPSPSVHRRFGM